ncbi:galectin-3-binding protein-like isoform X1 [Diadema antillarum]|uniref:galectin-3-binding protein-like isoform X1 n=1 Tax=Diadema antillarum TaxID=105358 RepID=UPI003A86B9FC
MQPCLDTFFILILSSLTATQEITEEGDIRLVNGSTSLAGRVEIFHNDSWGTVCNGKWSPTETQVVCRQLGLLEGLTSLEFFGAGEGPVHIQRVRCIGSESALADCVVVWSWEVETRGCGHDNDVGVRCVNSSDHFTTATMATESPPGSGEDLPTWARGLIVVLAPVGVAIVIILVFTLYTTFVKRRRRRQDMETTLTKDEHPIAGTEAESAAAPGGVTTSPVEKETNLAVGSGT